MFFTCKYNGSGRILMLAKGGDVRALKKSYMARVEDGRRIDLKFALVVEFPQELLRDERPYVHQYLRIKEDYGNETVSIEYVERP